MVHPIVTVVERNRPGSGKRLFFSELSAGIGYMSGRSPEVSETQIALTHSISLESILGGLSMTNAGRDRNESLPSAFISSNPRPDGGGGALVLGVGVGESSESDVSKAESSCLPGVCVGLGRSASYHPIGFINPTPPPSTRLIIDTEMFCFFFGPLCFPADGGFRLMARSIEGCTTGFVSTVEGVGTWSSDDLPCESGEGEG